MKKMSPEERNLFVTLYETYGIKKLKYEKESIEAKEELKKIKRIKKQDWFKQAYGNIWQRKRQKFKQQLKQCWEWCLKRIR